MEAWIDSAVWTARSSRYVDELNHRGLIKAHRKARDEVDALDGAAHGSREHLAAINQLNRVERSISDVERRHNYLPAQEYPWLPEVQPVAPHRHDRRSTPADALQKRPDKPIRECPSEIIAREL